MFQLRIVIDDFPSNSNFRVMDNRSSKIGGAEKACVVLNEMGEYLLWEQKMRKLIKGHGCRLLKPSNGIFVAQMENVQEIRNEEREHHFGVFSKLFFLPELMSFFRIKKKGTKCVFSHFSCFLCFLRSEIIFQKQELTKDVWCFPP